LRSELGGHGLADDHGAGLTQRDDAGRIATAAIAGKQRGAHAGRHVGGFDDVLDADGQAVDRRERGAAGVALRRCIGRAARAGQVEVLERLDLAFAGLDDGDAALEQRARRIAAGAKGVGRQRTSVL
jgi:hypothetical protein